VKGFKKCCISTYMLWNDKEDGPVRSELEEYEGTDCEDGDNDTDC
jgi:hypothetical protein